MLRRIQERVAVHDAIAQELGLFQPRNHAEYTALFRPLQMGLKANDVIKRRTGIVLPQLNHCIGAHARLRMLEADWL